MKLPVSEVAQVTGRLSQGWEKLEVLWVIFVEADSVGRPFGKGSKWLWPRSLFVLKATKVCNLKKCVHLEWKMGDGSSRPPRLKGSANFIHYSQQRCCIIYFLVLFLFFQVGMKRGTLDCVGEISEFPYLTEIWESFGCAALCRNLCQWCSMFIIDNRGQWSVGSWGVCVTSYLELTRHLDSGSPSATTVTT